MIQCNEYKETEKSRITFSCYENKIKVIIQNYNYWLRW